MNLLKNVALKSSMLLVSSSRTVKNRIWTIKSKSTYMSARKVHLNYLTCLTDYLQAFAQNLDFVLVFYLKTHF